MDIDLDLDLDLDLHQDIDQDLDLDLGPTWSLTKVDNQVENLKSTT